MASDSETFKLLLLQMEKLNHNLESASFATNNLTMQMSQAKDIIITPTSEPQPQQNSDEQREALPANGRHSTLGYVNWNDSHKEMFSSQRLIKMSTIQAAVNKVEVINEASPTPNQTGRNAITNGNHNSGQRVISGQFSFTNVYQVTVDRYTRFPMDAVYLDVNSPAVKEEMDFMNKLNVPAPEGVIKRFMKIVKSEMHTYKTFEKLHGLKWV